MTEQKKYDFYVMLFNLNHFDVTLRISLHEIMCVTYIQIMNDIICNFHFNIWYPLKTSYCVKLSHLQKHIKMR